MQHNKANYAVEAALVFAYNCLKEMIYFFNGHIMVCFRTLAILNTLLTSTEENFVKKMSK